MTEAFIVQSGDVTVCVSLILSLHCFVTASNILVDALSSVFSSSMLVIFLPVLVNLMDSGISKGGKKSISIHKHVCKRINKWKPLVIVSIPKAFTKISPASDEFYRLSSFLDSAVLYIVNTTVVRSLILLQDIGKFCIVWLFLNRILNWSRIHILLHAFSWIYAGMNGIFET